VEGHLLAVLAPEQGHQVKWRGLVAAVVALGQTPIDAGQRAIAIQSVIQCLQSTPPSGRPQERPQSGQQVGVYRDGRGRVDVVRQRTDALDPLDSDEEPARTRGGKIDLPERPDDKMMLEATNAAYLRDHPGVGEPVSEHQATRGEAEALRAFAHHLKPAAKPAATMPARPAGPALSHYARPTRGLGHPGQNLDLSRANDYLQGLADGATDSWQAAIYEAEARLGSGDPGAEMTRTR